MYAKRDHKRANVLLRNNAQLRLRYVRRGGDTPLFEIV